MVDYPLTSVPHPAPSHPAMSEHRATVRWEQAGGPFAKRQYSRAHSWSFDGGVTVAAAASPHFVPAQFTDPSAVDPEEAYVASIASCHMLSFLPLAALAGFEVLRYEDEAVGRMTKNERGKLWVSEIDLAPRITWKDGRAPTAEQEAEMHHRAHEECYIANSVRTEIRVRTSPARGARGSAHGSGNGRERRQYDEKPKSRQSKRRDLGRTGVRQVGPAGQEGPA